MEDVLELLEQKQLEYEMAAKYWEAEGLPGNAKKNLELCTQFGEAIYLLKAGNKSGS